MGKQNRSTQDIINTDLKAIYPAYYQWLIQYQHRHPEMRINNGGFAIKIRQEHVDRIEKIFEIREQERDNDHTFSNALLRLSYYGKDVDFWGSNKLDQGILGVDLGDKSKVLQLKQARSIKLCNALCNAVTKENPLSKQLSKLSTIAKDPDYDVLKHSRGGWNTFRNMMLSAACFIGVGLVFGAVKWLTTGSFYFRSESGAHRAQVNKALCTPFLGTKNLGRLKDKVTTHSAAAA